MSSPHGRSIHTSVTSGEETPHSALNRRPQDEGNPTDKGPWGSPLTHSSRQAVPDAGAEYSAGGHEML